MAKRVRKAQLDCFLHIRLTKDLMEFVSEEANRRLLKPSDIVREAILEKQKERNRGCL